MITEPAFLFGGPMHGQVISFEGGVREFYTPNTREMDNFFVGGNHDSWAVLDRVTYVPVGRTPEGRMIMECREDSAQASEKVPHEVAKFVVQSLKILTDAAEPYFPPQHQAIERAKYAQSIYLQYLGSDK